MLSSAATEAGAQPVRLILAAVATVLLCASLGQTVVSAALPVIVTDLGGLEHMTWLITAYLLASTVSAPIYGKLGDLFGRKVVIQAGLVVFTLGSLLCAGAQNMGMIVAGRAVQGLGAGGLIVVSMAVVGDILPPRDRGKVQGMLGAVFGLSTVIGPLIGGLLVQTLGWHSIFFVNVPVAVVAFVTLGVALKSRARVRRQIDYAGAVLMTMFLSATVLVANIGGSTMPWLSPTVLGLGAAALAALAGFVWREAHATEPVMPLALFRNNNFVVVNLVGFMVGVAMFGAITFVPLFMQTVKGLSPTASGIMLLPMMVGLIGTSALAGRAISRTGRYKLFPILSTGVLAAGMALMSTIAAETPIWRIAIYLFVAGIGIGPVMSTGVTAIQNAVPVSMLGVGTASANMFRMIGGSIGTAAFGAIFAMRLADLLDGQLPDELAQGGLGSLSPAVVNSLPEAARLAITHGFAEALHPIFQTASALALLACLISLALRELPLSTSLPSRREDTGQPA